MNTSLRPCRLARLHSLPRPLAGALLVLLATSLASAQKAGFQADLSGAAVVPAAKSKATGSAVASYSPATGMLDYFVSVQGMLASAAHVHKGALWSNGPVVATLNQVSPKSFTGGLALAAGALADLLHEGLFVDVHSAAFAGGEVRGQLASAVQLAAFPLGAEVVPATGSAATGVLVLSVTQPAATLRYELEISGLAATEAHIHLGKKGESGLVLATLTKVGPTMFMGSGPALSDPALLALLSGGAYVDVHTQAFPKGEIRGQIQALPLVQLAPQPPMLHSTLVDKDGGRIRDDELAQWMQALLIPGGKNDVRDAKFLFQQCYGGGMLDDLRSALGTSVRWVGGSASRHDQPSRGQLSTAENAALATPLALPSAYVADPPEDFWTKALRPELAKSQPLFVALQQAGEKSFTKRFDTAQSIVANGGQTIRLGDPGAASHHAILWGGMADKMRHFHDVENLRNALIAAWGAPGPKVTIDVLFGDGAKKPDGTPLPAAWNAQPATRAGLAAALTALQPVVDVNEQFLFYASDHGSRVRRLVPAGGALLPGASDVQVAELSPGEYEGMVLQPASQPTLVVAHQSSVPASSVSVSFNAALLGFLAPGATSTLFALDKCAIEPVNEVVLTSLAPSAVAIEELALDTGSVDSEPSPTLTADVLTISAAAGGVQGLLLEAGLVHAGKLYFLLGSVSGRKPGIALDGAVLPLNADAYLDQTLASPNHLPLVNSLGALDQDGRADAFLVLQPGLSPSVIGAIAHHAYVVIDPEGPTCDLVSNAIPCEVVP